ncbi:MAG: alpha-L-rhamnosidase C-terminal domain-containing protein, partial [Ginsengibacter sp.]
VYGDTGILRQQYPSMKAWVDFIKSRSQNYLWTDNGYGDWYAPGEKTPLPFIDECFFVYSTQLLIHAATILNNSNDILFYSEVLKKIKQAFAKQFGVIPQTQTACVLALQFDLLPDSLRQKTAEKLKVLITANNNHLATGFLGTPYLLHVLTQYGYMDLAYTLLLQQTYPSWLYPVRRGATTTWERWDAIRPADSTLQETSFNHYAYGAVGDWLYRVVAGIDAIEPGYKKIKIAPHPGGGLTWAKASYECSYGKIVSQWKFKSNAFLMHVEIPAGTTATIYVPSQAPVEVKAGIFDFVNENMNSPK